MPSQLELLGAARLTGIMQGLQDPRLLPQQLVWSGRIPDVDAVDEEIMARFIGTILIADLIADDAKAAVYSQGKFQFETTKIPNLKIGLNMTQSMLNQLDRLMGGMASTVDMGLFTNYRAQAMEQVLLGVRQRKEQLFVAMLTDGLDYDRLGIKLVNVTWGMPSDLKVTVAVPWTTAASATPITDIRTVTRIARIRYGITYNRISMSTSAFQYLVNTDEFKNQARLFGWGLTGMPAPVIPIQSDAQMMQLATRILDGMQIELYDARYWTQDTNGVTTSQPFLPINKVILTDSGNDGNANAYDFANGVVTETIVANAAPVNIMGRLPLGRGPVAYATAPPDLNSPNITFWGVARGFPRKKMLQSSAVLTVGTFADTVSVGVPFPS